MNGNIVSAVDFNGVETAYWVDTVRNLESMRFEAANTPFPRAVGTQWHPTFRLPVEIHGGGKLTTYMHDASGNVLTKTVLDWSTYQSRTWTYTYNSFGKVLTADGPRTEVSDITTYTYYSCTTGAQCGQLHTATNAAGHVTTYNSYNAHSQPLTITDPNGVLTTTHLRSAPATVFSYGLGPRSPHFEYWPTGLLKRATLPDGSYLEYTYDGAHRLTEIEDAEGNRIVYTLDNMGNRTTESLYDPSNALSQTREQVFNALNQLWKEIGAAGTSAVTTTFAYDDNGNQISISAPLGRNTAQLTMLSIDWNK